MKSHRQLHLINMIEIADPTALEINRALEGDTWQSCDYSDAKASRSNDFNFNPDYNGKSCSMTCSDVSEESLTKTIKTQFKFHTVKKKQFSIIKKIIEIPTIIFYRNTPGGLSTFRINTRSIMPSSLPETAEVRNSEDAIFRNILNTG